MKNMKMTLVKEKVHKKNSLKNSLKKKYKRNQKWATINDHAH